MQEVLVLKCKYGFNLGHWRCDCGACVVTRKRKVKKYKTSFSARKREEYVKSIMSEALDVSAGFDTLCPQHRPELLSLAKRFTSDPDRAEDLVQDALMRAFRHWDGFKQETDDINKDVRVWLKKILTNCFYTSWQRDQRHHSAMEDYATEATEHPEEAPTEEVERLRKVMDKLRPMYKEVLEKHYIEGLSYQQIADTLGIKFVQVQKRLYRARQYIKMYYELMGVPVPSGPTTQIKGGHKRNKGTILKPTDSNITIDTE